MAASIFRTTPIAKSSRLPQGEALKLRPKQLVYLAGSTQAGAQLRMLFEGNLLQPEITYVVANHGDVFQDVVDGVHGRNPNTVFRLAKEGTPFALVGETVLVVEPNCEVYLDEHGLLAGRPLIERDEHVWLENTAKTLGSWVGFPNLTIVLLSSGGTADFQPGIVRGLLKAGTTLIAPLDSAYSKPGENQSYPHLGGLTTPLKSAGVDIERCDLGILLARVVDTIEDKFARPVSGGGFVAESSVDLQVYVQSLAMIVEEKFGVRFSLNYRREFLDSGVKRVFAAKGLNVENETDRRRFAENLKDGSASECTSLYGSWTQSTTPFFEDGLNHWVDFMNTAVSPMIGVCLERGQKIRLGVLGCGAGQALWSLAILVSRAMAGHKLEGPLCDYVEIIGMDLVEGHITSMLEGRYHQGNFVKMINDTPCGLSGPTTEFEWAINEHFTASEESGWLDINEDLRSLVSGRVMDITKPQPQEKFDLLLCRDVVSILSEVGQDLLLDNWHQYLHPHGLFLVSDKEFLRKTRSVNPEPLEEEKCAYHLKSLGKKPEAPGLGWQGVATRKTLFWMRVGQYFARPVVLLDETGKILYCGGGSASLLIPSEDPNENKIWDRLPKMVGAMLRLEVAALASAPKDAESLLPRDDTSPFVSYVAPTIEDVLLKVDGKTQRYALLVRPSPEWGLGEYTEGVLGEAHFAVSVEFVASSLENGAESQATSKPAVAVNHVSEAHLTEFIKVSKQLEDVKAELEQVKKRLTESTRALELDKQAKEDLRLVSERLNLQNGNLRSENLELESRCAQMTVVCRKMLGPKQERLVFVVSDANEVSILASGSTLGMIEPFMEGTHRWGDLELFQSDIFSEWECEMSPQSLVSEARDGMAAQPGFPDAETVFSHPTKGLLSVSVYVYDAAGSVLLCFSPISVKPKEARVTSDESLVAEFMDQFPHPLWMQGIDGFSFVNHAFLEFMGRSVTAGHESFQLPHIERYPGLGDVLTQFEGLGEQPRQQEVVWPGADGQKQLFNLIQARVIGPQGERFLAGMAVKRDQGPYSMRSEADALKTMRQMAKMMTHDCRQPLNSLGLLVENLSRSVMSKLSAAEQHALKSLSGVATVSSEIMETLYTATFAAEDLPKEAIILNVRTEIQAVISEFWSENTASAPVTVDVAEDCDLTYPLRVFRQITRTLIDNAKRYCRQDGTLRITITAERVAGGVRLEIADNGIGFKLEEIGHHVFGPRRRFHPMTGQSAGMSLFTIKTILDELWGEISVESQPLKKTCFKLFLRDLLPMAKENT